MMSGSLPLAGRVALVTGGSRGLGAAAAESLAESGAEVVLAARSLSDLTRQASTLAAKGFTTRIAECDVTDLHHVQRAVDRALELSGRLDIVINCAGTPGPLSPIADVEPARWRETVDTNLIGAFYVAVCALKPFHSQGSGVLINISSGAASTAAHGFSAYCSAKAALAMLNKQRVARRGARARHPRVQFPPGSTGHRVPPQDDVRK